MKARLVIYLLLALAGISLFSTTEVFSQSPPIEAPPLYKTPEITSENSKPVAVKIHELENEGYEIYSAFLDDFAAVLHEKPDAKGVIITYGPEGELSGSGKRLLDQVKSYMEMKGFTEDRITAIYGGGTIAVAETVTELWMVPSDAKSPRPQKHHTNLASFTGMVGSHYGAEGPGELEYEAPSPGEVAMAAFSQIMRRQPDSIGYLVAYESKEGGLGSWRRIAQYDIEELKGYGVSADRLRIVHGATKDDFPEDQFWVLPKGEPLPIKEAAPDRLGDESVMVREFFEYQLEDSKDQELAFNGIADLLKENPDAKVCYMILPPFPDREDEPPKADFQQIVEKWRAKFVSELKINPDRIIVLYPTDVDEIFYGKMQSWIVPAKAALPSPPKVDDDPTDDDPPSYQH